MEKFQQLVNEGIAQLNWQKSPNELYEPIAYTLNLGGKRLRPALTLAAADLFGGDVRLALAPALGIELFHNFTLIHDDIMDNAPLRRGQATVYQKYNVNTAILSGDALFVEAYKLVVQSPKVVLSEVLQVFNQAALEVCEGQQLDMNYESLRSITTENYLEMIAKKTSVLIAAAMQMGAIIGGATEQDAKNLYDFGKYMGIAFQIQDDILDVFADAATFGKQVAGDILSNKNTFLKTKAYQVANETEMAALNHFFYAKNISDQQKIAEITAIFRTLNIQELAQAEMENQLNIATTALNKIDAAVAKKQNLFDFANYLIKRQV